jgi:hypothetical protein
MVEGDCGIPCQQFCCTAAAVKTLLPGEDELFQPHHPDVEIARRPWFMRVFQKSCCCVREHRMFVCRAFPFRPVLDGDGAQVVDLVKIEQEAFTPCWVTTPLPHWRERAMRAWQIVLDDADNRRMYSHVVYLRELMDFLEAQGLQLEALPDEQVRKLFGKAIAEMTERQERLLYLRYFPSQT